MGWYERNFGIPSGVSLERQPWLSPAWPWPWAASWMTAELCQQAPSERIQRRYRAALWPAGSGVLVMCQSRMCDCYGQWNDDDYESGNFSQRKGVGLVGLASLASEYLWHCCYICQLSRSLDFYRGQGSFTTLTSYS